MPSLFTEDTYEQAIIELFQNMGYDHLYAPDMERDYSSPLLDAVLRDSLVRINLGLPVEAINEAITKLKNFDTGSLLQKNIIFMDYLQNGITVKFFVKGEERSSIVRLIDYTKVQNNAFYVVNQFTFIENDNNRRPDIIRFVIICRISHLCFTIMSFVSLAICLRIKQERLHPDWIDLWNGKARMGRVSMRLLHNLILSMKACFKKNDCLIF